MNLTKIIDVFKFLTSHAPLSWQEDYDNCGLLVGDFQTEVSGILTCLDVTEAVIDEAVAIGANLIVTHHPIIYKGLKKLSGNGYVEKTMVKAIKNEVAIIAIHTNLDNAFYRGINEALGKLIGLENLSILQPKHGLLTNLKVQLSESDASSLILQLQNINPQEIHYSANHLNGSFGQLSISFFSHQLKEVNHLMDNTLGRSTFRALTNLSSTSSLVGAGMLGYLEKSMEPIAFLNLLKENLSLSVIKHTKICKKEIKKVAFCGGSGSFLLSDAIREKADIFITSDYKYHQFFDANNEIIIADIGHYESEVCAIKLLMEIISEKFTNFAVRSTTVSTNPVYYHQ